MEPNLSLTIPVGVAIGMSIDPLYMGPLLLALYVGVILSALPDRLVTQIVTRRQTAFWFGLACFYGSIFSWRWPWDTLSYVAITQAGCYLAVF